MEIVKVIENIRITDQKPERISLSKIGKKIGKLSLIEKHFDKLPLTKEYIDRNVESSSQFKERRILWAVNALKNEEKDIKAWKILKKSGIRNCDEAESLIISIIYSELK